MTKTETLEFIKQILDKYYDDSKTIACWTNFKKDGYLRFDIHDTEKDNELPKIQKI